MKSDTSRAIHTNLYNCEKYSTAVKNLFDEDYTKYNVDTNIVVGFINYIVTHILANIFKWPQEIPYYLVWTIDDESRPIFDYQYKELFNKSRLKDANFSIMELLHSPTIPKEYTFYRLEDKVYSVYKVEDELKEYNENPSEYEAKYKDHPDLLKIITKK